MEKNKTLQYICAVLGALLGFCFGELNGYFTPVSVRYHGLYYRVNSWVEKKELSSAIGFNGLAKKVFIFCLVALGHIIDVYVLGTGAVLQSRITLFFS